MPPLRERVKGDTQGIKDVQGALVKRIYLLKKKVREANVERDAVDGDLVGVEYF